MKTSTCYYLDSLKASSINPQLRKTIDAAMVLYATETGSNKRVNVKWVNSRCPCQPGSTECGYYMLNFMKEIVDEGVTILTNDNVGGKKLSTRMQILIDFVKSGLHMSRTSFFGEVCIEINEVS